MSLNNQEQATISTLLQKKVFILAGLTGSGKSTLAKQISQILGCEYLSSDKLREELANQSRFDTVGDEAVEQARHSVYSVMYKQAAKLVQAHKKVVLDATHIEPDKYESLLAELIEVVPTSDLIFVTVKTHSATIQKRMVEFPNWKRVFSHMQSLFKTGQARWPSYKKLGVEVVSATKVVAALKSIHTYKGILHTIEQVVWDLDGTLYPPNKKLNAFIETEKTKRVAEHLGVSEVEAQKKFEAMYKKLASGTRTLNELGLSGEDFFISIWQAADFSEYIQTDDNLAELFQNVHAKNQYQMAMLTNTNTQETVSKKVTAIGLKKSFFNPIITSVEVGYHKPDHRAFAQILSLNSDSSRILYIGDKEHTDIVPANALGMKSCLITWSGRADTQQLKDTKKKPVPRASVATMQLSSPHDLLRLLLLS